MKAIAVIGANYGDEGKGLITDFITVQDRAGMVVRYNGGAQAGHTVKTPDGQRHVFHHFASGSLAGASTYLSSFFLVNPLLFRQEYQELAKKKFLGTVFADERALVTTPYDMLINQWIEDERGAGRHGSCGVGISETVQRSKHQLYRMTIADCKKHEDVRRICRMIRLNYVPLRLTELGVPLTDSRRDLLYSDPLLEDFIESVMMMLTWTTPYFTHRMLEENLQTYKLVFEGAQGLLLDQNYGDFPHVTRSNTGLQNIGQMCSKIGITELDVIYVTRAYLTRHGAGPLQNELDKMPGRIVDETNLPHPYQGTLRFAHLDLDRLKYFIHRDMKLHALGVKLNPAIAVTCLDQVDEVKVYEGGTLHTYDPKYIGNRIATYLGFKKYYESYGPTRESVWEYDIHAASVI